MAIKKRMILLNFPNVRIVGVSFSFRVVKLFVYLISSTIAQRFHLLFVL